MLCHPISVDIAVERPLEKAEICAWMYMRNVSEDQRPCFRIVALGMLLRCMAMAPPARSEWLLTEFGGKPFLSKPMARTVILMAVLMSPGCSASGR